MASRETNWAGNLNYSAARIHRPASLADVQSLVARSRRIRALGTRHSFSDVADTTGDLISMAGLDKVLGIDPAAMTVTIEGGITYGQLGPILDRRGLGLRNLASLPHISVVGACATATHGSGVGNQTLAASVRSVEMVVGDGDVVSLSRGDADFDGAVVGLGALGIVTKATLDLVARFDIAQTVYDRLPLSDLQSHFIEIMSGGYSVSLFYDWQTEAVNQVWVKRLCPVGDSPGSIYGAMQAEEPRHPLAGLSVENCTTQLGIPGPWYERLPHFRLDFTPSNGVELQSEYFVPLDRGFEAMEAVRTLRDHLKPILQVSEIRTVAADELWLSPAYGRANLGIHFTWHKDWSGVRAVLPLIEEVLAPFDPRPHWGKLFTMEPARFRNQYAQLPDFRRLAESFDPKGKFRNRFLDENFFSDVEEVTSPVGCNFP